MDCSGLFHLGQQLAASVFPPECAVCQTEVRIGRRLCAECRNLLCASAYCCQRCAMPLPEVISNESCIHCRKNRWLFSKTIALGRYRGKLREAVIVCKKLNYEKLRMALAKELVPKIRQQISSIDQQNPVLIPIPNHWSRAFASVAPTAESLAYAIASDTQWPLLTGKINRIRKTRKQGTLSLAERKQNVRGAFLKNDVQSLTGRHILIVDDVLTTGATANEVARQLRREKPLDISLIVLARASGR